MPAISHESDPCIIQPYRMTCFISKAFLKLTQHCQISESLCKTTSLTAMLFTITHQTQADSSF